MKKIIIALFVVLWGNSNFAQDEINLIMNPSFESTSGKLKKLKQINIAKEWDSPTALKADLYSTEKDLPVSAPVNQKGKEHPWDGENYAGILVYSYNNKEPRTYIQTELASPLSKDLEYCVKFYTSLSDLSKYAVNNIGAYFSKDPLYSDKKEDLIFQKKNEYNHVVRNVDNKVYNARYNWEPVCAIYKASGKESYLTIGNFYNNKETKYEKLKKMDGFTATQIPSAYYYIDQVEVYLIEDITDCDCNNQMDEINSQTMIYHKDFFREDGKYTIEEMINMGSVYFDVNSAKIDEMFDDDLNKMAKILIENESINIELHGHTDKMEFAAIKKDPENEKLINLGSIRAENVRSYLIKKGVSEDRITFMNHDAAQPASAGYSELSLAKNRRVDFKIVE
jgi:outer membrane protein OmpA-like peptidoglycan-associated protein